MPSTYWAMAYSISSRCVGLVENSKTLSFWWIKQYADSIQSLWCPCRESITIIILIHSEYPFISRPSSLWQGDAMLALQIYFCHSHHHMLMKFYHLRRILNVTVWHLGYMNQTIVVDTYIYKGTKLGNVGNNARTTMPTCKSSISLMLASNSNFSTSPRGSKPGLSSSAMISVKVGIPTSALTYFLISIFFCSALSSPAASPLRPDLSPSALPAHSAPDERHCYPKDS